MGARFEYDGKVYVKTGPLVGSGAGGQRLIPKYAVLSVPEGAHSAPPKPGQALMADRVLAAFERYHACCEVLVPAQQHAALAAARAAFLKEIE
jgi:hypothetical protein